MKGSKGKSLKKGGVQPKSSTRSKSSAKRQKTSHNSSSSSNSTENDFTSSIDGTALSKAQVTYAILFICDIAIRMETLSESTPINRTFLTTCILAGLEASRFRTVTSRTSCSLLEHNWLWSLERSLVDYIVKHQESSSDPIYTYVDAMCELGCGFYEGVYPLVLIDTVLSVVTNDTALEDCLRDKVVSMCAQLLLDSATPLDVYTLPVSFDSFLSIDDICEGSLARIHRDFTAKKFHVIIETFLSKVNVAEPSHKKFLTQVLEHFESLKDVRLLQLITRDLRLHLPKLQEAGKLDSCLRIVINSIRLGKTHQHTLQSFFTEQKDKEFMFSLANSVGLSCVKLFVGEWKSFLLATELKKLLMTLKPLLGSKQLPSEVVTMIMQYYDCKDKHEADACDLLAFFKPGDANHSKAIKKILANSVNFHYYALFALAKSQFQEKQGKTSNKNNTEVMDEATFEIVELALKGIQSERWNSVDQTKTYEYLDWICELSTAGNVKDVAKSSLFNRLMNAICKHAAEHPSLLLHVLQFLEKSPPLLKQVTFLGSALIGAYKVQFDRQFQECGHAAYDKVISEMVKARLHSKQYVKGGDTKFDKTVLTSVKLLHNGKKKLMRMLDITFGDKKNDSKSSDKSDSSYIYNMS